MAACNSDFTILNAVPRISSIGPVEVKEGYAVIHIAVQDIDGDPVDVELSYEFKDGTSAGVKQVAGGHGTSGLTSSKEAAGKGHIISWDIAGIDSGKELRFRAIPDDRETGIGNPFYSSFFTLKNPLDEINVNFGN